MGGHKGASAKALARHCERSETILLSAQPREALLKAVIPAKAGIQGFESFGKSIANWIPAFAGMTPVGLLQSFLYA